MLFRKDAWQLHSISSNNRTSRGTIEPDKCTDIIGTISLYFVWTSLDGVELLTRRKRILSLANCRGAQPLWMPIPFRSLLIVSFCEGIQPGILRTKEVGCIEREELFQTDKPYVSILLSEVSLEQWSLLMNEMQSVIGDERKKREREGGQEDYLGTTKEYPFPFFFMPPGIRRWSSLRRQEKD